MKQIQFITHENSRFSYADGAEMALKGGCRWIQLRMKEVSDADFISVAEKIAPMCREYGATFILDDRVHLVNLCKADGVHLGRNDMPVTDARAILGRDAIIGGTANTIDDIENYYNKKITATQLENIWKERKEQMALFVNHGFLDKISVYIGQLTIATNDNSPEFETVYKNIESVISLIKAEQKFALHSFY